MRTLVFSVKGQRLTQKPTCDFTGIVPGTVGYLRAQFEFDSDWDGCNIAASFFNDKQEEEWAFPVKDNVCMIPAEVLNGYIFYVSVTGKRKDYKILSNKLMVRQGG